MSVHSLHFGLNYPGTPHALRGCVNDALDIAALAKPFCATTITVLDDYATRENANLTFEAFKDRFKRNDIGIVTISSHGTRERHAGKWVEGIVWSDMEVSFDYELDEALSDFPSGCLLLVAFDSCHAGGLNRNPHKIRAIPISKVHSHKPAPPKRRTIPYLGWGACLPTEYAYDAEFDGRPNGAFTYYMLKASKELPAKASYHDWFMRIASKRKGYLPTDDYPQTPVEFGSSTLKKRKVPF